MAASQNPRARLEHILFHIRGVDDTISGASFETFASVYHFERARSSGGRTLIASEIAVNHLPKLKPVIEAMLAETQLPENP
jgi:hypothetical protein